MRQFVESLSLGSGAGIVAALSALLTWVLFKLPRGRAVWLLPLALPLLISYSLYWLPVWMGAGDVAQFGAWAVLSILPWYLVGACTSACVVLLLRSLRK
jgi:Flp pilus assembly protein protease CpaA